MPGPKYAVHTSSSVPFLLAKTASTLAVVFFGDVGSHRRCFGRNLLILQGTDCSEKLSRMNGLRIR